MAQRVYTLKALTDIWTGDADQAGRRLLTTGLLGAIRWWFEVVVRGLGGRACDPTEKGVRCPASRSNPTEAHHHCVACELFGCTGWARKFRFEVLDENNEHKYCQIRKGDIFLLSFTELRPIHPVEWALLDVTLGLIVQFGALGGKTVLKPSDERHGSDRPYHRDYGLIDFADQSRYPRRLRRDLENFVRSDRWRSVAHGAFAWASLEHFWCVRGRYLTRCDAKTSSFNRVLGCHEHKKRSRKRPLTAADSWLAGGRGVSKKVFSFKEPKAARRTFGFVHPDHNVWSAIYERLGSVWHGLQDSEIWHKETILEKLL